MRTLFLKKPWTDSNTTREIETYLRFGLVCEGFVEIFYWIFIFAQTRTFQNKLEFIRKKVLLFLKYNHPRQSEIKGKAAAHQGQGSNTSFLNITKVKHLELYLSMVEVVDAVKR